MGKKLKIAIIVVVVIVGLIIFVGLASTPYINTDVSSITGVSQFFVIHDGNLYKARFSLVDKDNVAAASDAKVQFGMTDSDGIRLYSTSFDISSSDFKQYELILTGAPVIAYAWQIDQEEVVDSGAVGLDTATLTVTLPNGKVLSDSTTTT